MPVIISPALRKSLEAALYDLTNSENELAVLVAAGRDTAEYEAIRSDLKKNLTAYLEYANRQRKGSS